MVSWLEAFGEPVAVGVCIAMLAARFPVATWIIAVRSLLGPVLAARCELLRGGNSRGPGFGAKPRREKLFGEIDV